MPEKCDILCDEGVVNDPPTILNFNEYLSSPLRSLSLARMSAFWFYANTEASFTFKFTSRYLQGQHGNIGRQGPFGWKGGQVCNLCNPSGVFTALLYYSSVLIIVSLPKNCTIVAVFVTYSV